MKNNYFPTNNTQTRKDDHLKICLEENVQCRQITNGLENYRFDHCCLPELNFTDIDLTTSFLGRKLGYPLLISSMTGGTENAKLINCRLAEIAQAYKIPMGVGSGRVVIEKPEVAETFNVRHLAPDVPLWANLGAVQLNYGYGWQQCLKLVDLLEADALILHLNPLQECIQPHGDTNFSKLLDQIELVCDKLSIPVIVKEVGNGISASMAQKLWQAGVKAIDVAGAGGTSWAKVESERAETSWQRQLGQTFADWGIPTADCLLQIRQSNSQLPLIASGGIRNGLEVVKALALGADLVGLAFPFLKAASKSPQALDELMQLLIAEIKTTLFCTGNSHIKDLKESNCLQKVINNRG
jgi:isopentenyl-diphosphate delta-isomerase